MKSERENNQRDLPIQLLRFVVSLARQFYAVIVACAILHPILGNAQLPNHAYNPINLSNPYGLTDLDNFAPGDYDYSKWGNFMDESTENTVNLRFSWLTAGPFDVTNPDLLLLSDNFVTPTFTPLPAQAWQAPSGTADGHLTFARFPGLTGSFPPLYLFRKFHFSNSLTNDLSGNELDANTHKLILLIHGRNPGKNADQFSTSTAFVSLKDALKSRLQGSQGLGWQLSLYHWEKDSDTGPNDLNVVSSAAESATIGHEHGQHLGELLAAKCPNLQKVQLIAHSSGAWVARAAARYLLQRTGVKVQVTLLDPFVPGELPNNTPLTANVISAMPSMDPTGSGQLVLLENYFAIDVSDVYGIEHATSVTFGWNNTIGVQHRIDWGYSSTPGIALWYASHEGPIQFYADTVNSADAGLSSAGLENGDFDLNAIGWKRSMYYQEKQLRATLTNVSPTTLPTSSSPQLMKFYGINFKPQGDPNASILIFTDPAGNTYTRVPTFISAGELQYQINVQSAAGTWKVKVVNGGVESSPFIFSVVSGTAGGGGTQTQELIVNPGFENSTTGWTVLGGAGVNTIAGSSAYAHAGSKYLILGGAVGENDAASQSVQIPSGVTAATLSFWFNITSSEATSVAFDNFSATIRTTSGAYLATVGTWSNVNKDPAAGNPYYHQATFNLLPYKGQTILIYFTSVNDSTLITSFRLDDVSVQVVVPTPATFSSLVLNGPSSVTEGTTAQYTATAVMGDGSTQPASPSWSVNSSAASISSSGFLTAGVVSGDTAVTVSASLTINGVTQTASQNITIVNVPAPVTLVSLSISGPSSVNENSLAQYTATALLSDGSTPTVTSTWSVNSSVASISSSGLLSAGSVNSDTAAALSASYTVGGVTRTASKGIIVVNSPTPTFLVTPSAEANGSISPNTPQTVNGGGSVPFTATPANLYVVDQWFVNGVATQTGGTSFTLNNVTASTSVQVTFKATPTRIISLGGNLTFGSVTAGTSAQNTLTISNPGNTTLTVGGINYPSGFSGNWSGGTIAAGGSQNVTVTFVPTAAASYGGNVTVNSDATSGTGTISASGTGTSASTTPTIYEAENAVVVGAVVANNVSGYSGSGFVDYINPTADYTEWTVNVPSAGTYVLTFRYGNGSTADRPLELRVNGAVTNGRFSFPPTGGWTSWAYVTNSVTLNTGNNTIRITAIGYSGANVDSLQVAKSAALTDTQSPMVTITSPTSNPTYSTSSSTVNLGGTTSDNVGVTQVTWSNDRGGSGTASGTTSWSINSISLQSGVNVITVTARDAANNSSTDTITVTYTPPAIYYSVTLSASPSNGGTVSGGGTLVANSTAIASATASTGFVFVNWTENGSVVSTSLSYAFTLNANRNLTANFAPVGATNVVFSDNFADNSLNQQKWTASGNTVGESNGMMNVWTTVTDKGGNLWSVAVPINPTGKITITRRVFLHYGNNYFMGRFGITIGTLGMFAVEYANINYADGKTYMARYGFFLSRSNGNPTQISDQANVSSAITPVWDTWFNEKITYDPVSGVMEYFINDISRQTYNVGVLPPSASPTMTLSFDAWGWYTGHQQSFDDLVVTQTPVATGGLPSPWRSQDIGSPTFAGNSTGSNGTFIVVGQGGDFGGSIAGSADQGQFMYQFGSSNCSVSVRCTAIQATADWAKGGVIIRDSLNATSAQAMVVVTPSNGVAFQYRTSTGGTSSDTHTTGLVTPYWVRVTRVGSTFTGYRSADGVAWTSMGTVTINMGPSVYIGLVVTSHAAPLCTATFDNVTATP